MMSRKKTIGSLLHLYVLAVTLTASPVMAQTSSRMYAGVDSNEYPGDAVLPVLARTFSFTGYWLNNPPGARTNEWVGRRDAVTRAGLGFLVLYNGRLDRQINREMHAAHTPPATLGRKDGQAAVAAARKEGFHASTILFLDQEEGGRMLPEQMSYLLAWSEAVAASGFRPGVYASGQAVPDGPGKTITTMEDIRDHVAAQHLHEIAMWVYQDACPPAPGCTPNPPPLSASGTPGAIVWQYAQSPRRPANTAACARTYAADGNCYAVGLKSPTMDLSVAASQDPSGGR